MTQFVNILLYQVGWFACVLGLAWDLQWLGASIAISLMAIHFGLAADRALQVKLVLLTAALGLIVDSVQLRAGIFDFRYGLVVEWLPPLCIVVLWMQFATTFRYGMRWLSGRYLLCAGFGLLGAPVAFFAGERLGAISFLPPRIVHYAVLGVIWSVSVPLLIYISDRLGSGAVSPHYCWLSTNKTRPAGGPDEVL